MQIQLLEPTLDLHQCLDPVAVQERRYRYSTSLVGGQFDSERFLSDSILEPKDLAAKKKELDKITLKAIQNVVASGEHDKIFTYIEQLYFSKSLDIIVKMCAKLNQNLLAQKISKHIKEKEQRDLIEAQRTAVIQSAFDSRQVSNCLQTSSKIDLADFSVGGPVQKESVVEEPKQSLEEPKATENAENKPDLMNLLGSGIKERPLKQESAPVKVNPFVKTKTQDLAKHSTQNKDIFGDLQKNPSGKRANPFGQFGLPQSHKQKKLK